MDVGDFAPSEPFQSYVDGGIFLQSLVMAIHSVGLGSCLFQAPKGNRRYEGYKKVMKINSCDDVICVVGFGYLKDTVRYIETHRKDVDDVAINIVRDKAAIGG